MSRVVNCPRRLAVAAVVATLLLARSPPLCEAVRRPVAAGAEPPAYSWPRGGRDETVAGDLKRAAPRAEPVGTQEGIVSSPLTGGGRLRPRSPSATSLGGRRPPQSVAASRRSRGWSLRGRRREVARRRPWRRAALPLLTAAAAVAQLPGLADGQQVQVGILEPGRALGELGWIKKAALNQVQILKWSLRPDGGLTVPRANLKGAQLREFLSTKGARDWRYEWAWQPVVFFWDYGNLAQLSGLYRLVELNPEEARWERLGGGREARMHYKREYGSLTLISIGREGHDLFQSWAHFACHDDEESDDDWVDFEDWAEEHGYMIQDAPDFEDAEALEAWAEEQGYTWQEAADFDGDWEALEDWATDHGYTIHSLDSIGDDSSGSSSDGGGEAFEVGRVDLSSGEGFGMDHVDLDDPDEGGGFGTQLGDFKRHLEFSHQVGNETRLWAAFEMQTDTYWEGMPMYRSNERDPDYPHKDKWIVSMRGQWHYGEAPPGFTIEELASSMFFEIEGLYGQHWALFTWLHAGDPPEDFVWYGWDG